MNHQSIETAFPCHVPDRLLDDTLLTFDLPGIINKIMQERAWKAGERNGITLLKTAQLRIVLIALHVQNEIDFHRSGNPISIQIIEGQINFKTEKQSVILKKDNLLTCHEGVKHSLVAMEESVLLLTIGPG